MVFLNKLRAIQRTKNTLLCIGLDTDSAKLPEFLKTYANPQFEFNKRIIAATKDLVCAFKINSAFYEAEGERGWSAMRQTVSELPASVISIADAKRGDIGNSSEQYARIFVEEFKFDSITVNPYMGKDSVEPFLRSPEQCAFILALTSNPGSKDFQRLKVGKKFLYEKIVETAMKWSVKKNIGFVAGATKPKELRSIRKLAPTAPLLIPGIGTQGGSVKEAVQYGCDKNGEMAIINVSRSILYASGGDDFAESARNEAIKIRDEINFWREKFFKR